MTPINDAKRSQDEVRRLWREFRQVNDSNQRRPDCVNDSTLDRMNARLDRLGDRLAKARAA